MARRARGEGSIYYDKTRRRWVGSIDAGRRDNGKRRRVKASAPTKAECVALLAQLADERRKTGTVAARDVTVSQVVADWLAHPPARIKSPITKRVNAQHGAMVTAAVGTVPLVKLSVHAVEAMLHDLAAKGKSTSVLVQVRSVLRRSIARAMRDGLVSRNVAALAEVPQGTRRESRSMTREQIGKLLSQDMTSRQRAYLMLGIGCGLRPGELLGLRWADVDLEAGTLAVRHALHEITPAEPGPHVLELAELKTPSSRRTLRMPAPVITALRTHRARQAEQRLRDGHRWQDHDLVLAGPHGGPLWPQGVRRNFVRLCERAGIGSDWHPHEQRHTFVSVLSDAGKPIEAIAAAVGHKNPGVTKSVYWHSISPEITTAAEVMGDVLDTSPEAPE
jgi:integrase